MRRGPWRRHRAVSLAPPPGQPVAPSHARSRVSAPAAQSPRVFYPCSICSCSPCTALGRGGGARSPYSQRLVRGSRGRNSGTTGPSRAAPQAPRAPMTESPAPARSALNWAEEPPPRQLLASRERRGAERGIPEARRRRGALRWPVAGARGSGLQLQTSWAAVGAGRGVAGRWRPARNEAPPRGLESRDTTRPRPPAGPSREARKGGARATRVHPLRVLPPSTASCAPSSLFLTLFSSVLFARIQTSSTARMLSIVFGKRGIEGFLFLPL